MNYSQEYCTKENTFTYCPQKQLNIFKDGKNVITNTMCGITVFTETLEPSDPDEIQMLSTIMTKSIEPIDPDEILLNGTVHTATIEPTDPDEIII